MDNSRSILKVNTKLRLRNRASGGEESFVVRELIGQGGSSVCYRAVRGDSKGLLKEFYPYDLNSDYIGIVRTKDNQLVAAEGYAERFEAMKSDFTQSITLLTQINFSSDSDVLNNYIPSFELFEGAERNSTVYVWCKENAGYPFADYIGTAWKNPRKDTEIKLYNILATVKTIAVSIVAMHKNGLLHRDIKPDNFLLFKDGLGNINPNNISLFDINSFSYGSRSTLIVGTPGFKAPEVDSGKANYYSDIYSIGAMLFYALTHKVYRREYYGDINTVIEESELMSTNDVYLKSRIISVLQKTLAYKPNMRYEKTEALVSALDKAIVRLLPYTESKKLDSNQKFKIIENIKPIDAIPVFQDLFYKKPVYDWFPENSDAINVLVAGGGLYAQAFMDVALQTLQIKGKRLKLTVVSDSPDYDKQIYLKYRPDLGRFFDVDRKDSQKDSTSYGSINYIEGNFVRGGDVDRRLINNLVSRTNPCYILVSLGDDKMNHSVAREFAYTNVKALVSFVYSSGEKKFSKVNPVYINQRTKYKNIDSNLIRMAFNTHLVWNDSIDADIDRLYREFRQIYNFKSSIASALSIPYKLYSIGVNAENSEDFFNRREWMNDDFLRELSYVEHNRWVTEKLVNGWSAPLTADGVIDSSQCLSFNGDKSAKSKQHLCIAKTTASEFPVGINWDTCNTEKLDPLDRISIEMYRHFKKAADEYRNNYFLSDQTKLSDVRKCLPDDNPKLIRLFNEYEMTVNSIVRGNSAVRSSKFKSLKYRLCTEMGKSIVINRDDVIRILDDIGRKLQPAIFCSKKTNYKALDDIMIRSIPFIIGNRPRPSLATVFEDGRADGESGNSVFADVASSLLIIPGHIKYLYYYTSRTDISVLSDAIAGVLAFFDNRHMKNTFEFIFVFEGECSTEFHSVIRELAIEKNIKVKLYEDSDVSKATDIFARECRNCMVDGTNLPFDSEEDNRIYTERMRAGRYFEFDSQNMEFQNIFGCEYLGYIDTSKVNLRAEDMFALKGAECTFDIPDMSEFYKNLWKVYADSSRNCRNGVWNSLCTKLGDYHRKNDVVAAFYRETPSGVNGYLKKILPIECYAGVIRLIDELTEKQIILSGQAVVVNSDACMLEIAYDRIYEKVEELFAHYEIMCKKLTVHTCENTGVVVVRCDSMYVTNIRLTDDEYRCLIKLADSYMVNDIAVHGDGIDGECRISFTYASTTIKNALTVNGTVLQLYIYYSIIDSGEYDDIKTNVAVKLDCDEICFDIVLTKGMRSVFVECKSNKLKDEQYWRRLAELQRHFGVNSTVIAVVDSDEFSTEALECIPGVRIVSVLEDVIDIAKILSDIFYY